MSCDYQQLDTELTFAMCGDVSVLMSLNCMHVCCATPSRFQSQGFPDRTLLSVLVTSDSFLYPKYSPLAYVFKALSSLTRQIPCLSYGLKFLYHIPALNHMNPLQTLKPHVLKIRLNIGFYFLMDASTLQLVSYLLLPNYNFVYISRSPISVACAVHPPPPPLCI